MRIAQVAPLFESVPPQRYGGTERVVGALTDELVRLGHDVTLFASGDSITNARLVPTVDRALRLSGAERDHGMYAVMEFATVLGCQDDFDVIHNHIDHVGLPFARLSRVPTVTTAHGRLDLPEGRMYRHFPDVPLVSVSDAQRAPAPNLTWMATVYNGIDFSRFTLREQPGSYLVFLGRISPEKRADRAIEIARELGMPLRIAAKVGSEDQTYFENAIRPLLDDPLVEFLGEVNDVEKDDLLGNAYALLFPIDWPEPFGMAAVEAMACGTPVVATNCGAVPEIVRDGVTGFVCHSLRELLVAVENVTTIDRTACHDYAEERFSATRMAHGYEAAYRAVIGRFGERATPSQQRNDVGATAVRSMNSRHRSEAGRPQIAR